MLRRRALVLTLLALGAGSGPAHAASDPTATTSASALGSSARPHVVITSLKGCCPGVSWGAAEALLADEFTALDLVVELVPAAGPPARTADLEAVAAARTPAFVLTVSRISSAEGGGARLWLLDRVAGTALTRDVRPAGKAESEEAAILALRAVEILRASLLELDVPAERLPGAVDASVEEDGGSDAGPFGVRLGVGGLGSPGGGGARGTLGLALSYSPLAELAVEVEGLVTVVGDMLIESGQSASLDVAAVRAWALWEVRPQGWLRPALGVGGGVLLAWSRGTDTADHEGRTDEAATGYLGGVVRIALVLSRTVRLQLGVRAGVSLPSVTVRLSEDVAHLGEPLLEGYGALEVRF